MQGKIFKISISKKKGTKKTNIKKAYCKKNWGIIGDSHASNKTHRQISLLAIESIETMKKSYNIDLFPGDFAENITTIGIDFKKIKKKDKIKLGKEVILEITQLGKKCHNNECEIFKLVGNCIMPKEGVFAKVIKEGNIKQGDEIGTISF